MSSPDPDYFDPYLFRFINCTNFQISGINETLNQGDSRWIGGAYDRWIHANILSWYPIQDKSNAYPEVVVPSTERPLVYLRGNPKSVPHATYRP